LRVKVCGITSGRDAARAVDCGAHALGFNFYPPSPRYLPPSDAREIIRHLPPFVTTVGVFVNAGSPEWVAEQARLAGVQVLQLHGDESPAYCASLRDWPVVKALRVRDRIDERVVREYQVHALLLDAHDGSLYGGTGRSFDWEAVSGLLDAGPIILAGGLNPANVTEAIRRVRPYAVDVCTGVETEPGVKDPELLARFMQEVRRAELQDLR